jgi:hypothetical protein
MSRTRRAAPSLGVWFALMATTGRWRTPGWFPGPDAVAAASALRDGWTFRCASPRWDAIWVQHAPALAASRIAIFPRLGFGLDGDEYLAVVRARLSDAGLPVPDADPIGFRSAVRTQCRALSPWWSRTHDAIHDHRADGR